MASRHFAARALALFAGSLLAAAPNVFAQSSGNGFLFRRPSVGLTLHGGYAHANAGSDIFTFSRNASARSCTLTSSCAVVSVTMPRSRSAFFTALV